MTNLMRSQWTIAIVLTSLLGITGCNSDRPDLAKVTGKVLVNGEPVTKGRITFYPGSGRPATSAIQEDGTYELTTFEKGDGAMLGESVVTIKSANISEPVMPKSFEEELKLGTEDGPKLEPQPIQKIEWLVPEEYSDRKTTPLKRQVEDQINIIDFELSD